MFSVNDINLNVGTLITTFVIFCVTYFIFNYGFYWWLKGVPGPFPLPLIGNSFPRWMGTLSLSEYDRWFYSDYGGKRFCGFFEYSQKTIMIGDLILLKHILVKDFDNFVNRSNVSIGDPLVDKMVLVLQDEMWKRVRSVLTPAFSTDKIEAMIPIMTQTSEHFLDQLFKNTDEVEVEQDVCELLRMFAMDVVATIALDIEVDELSQKKAQFTTNSGKIFTTLPRWKRFFYLFVSTFPILAKMTKGMRDESSPLFFKQIIEETLRQRKYGTEGSDFLNMLKEARQKELNEQDKVLSDDVLLAQCIVILAAGVDTMSTTLSLFLHSLAFHQDIQEKVLEEIDSCLEKSMGVITYKALSEMTYLDMVLQETLRMYPSAPRTYRVSKDKYTLPGTDITLDPGTTVVIPIRCIHYDHEYYKEPETFNPQRFSAENKARRNPMAFLTFGQGPRNCIGMSFANMEIKAFLVTLLRKTRVHQCLKSRNPVLMNQLSGVFRPEGGVWIKIAKRSC